MNFHIKSSGEAPGILSSRDASFAILELGGSLKEHTFESVDEELTLVEPEVGLRRIVSMSFQPGIPRRVALQSSPPLPRMENIVIEKRM